ncbi:MAG: hypothetical protein ACOYOU_11315 [Kiritimatiellia bacterium]
MKHAIKIAACNPRSRFVALDSKNKAQIIAEGGTADSVARKAARTGKAFSMMFVPVSGKTYVF